MVNDSKWILIVNNLILNIYKHLHHMMDTNHFGTNCNGKGNNNALKAVVLRPYHKHSR